MSEIEWDIPHYRQHGGLSTRSIFGSEFNLVVECVLSMQ